MSYLDRMSIQGLRSFSPDEEQVITFSSPLTLILGPNGTGKTTIIESLRYLTTGEYPPNSDRGQAFIHDPKLAGEREIKGKVKLRFLDTTGHEVVTTRVMEGQQKLKRLQVKSLEGTIQRKDDMGHKHSISSKCTELDREMVSMLGVSKAILNNVIFCHQEESNWPLSEGKSLKEKFDDIFAATRYVKALENLHSIRTKLDSNAKIVVVELQYVEKCKIQAAKMTAELEKTEKRLTMSSDKIQELKEDLKPIDKSLEEIRDKELVISKLHNDQTQKKTEFELEKKACEELKRQIQNEFVGSEDDLKMEIYNFETDLDKRKKDKNKIEKDVERLENDIKENSTKRSEILIQLGNYKAEAKKHSENIEARDKYARVLHSEYNLNVKVSNTGALATSEFDEIKHQISDKLQLMAKNSEETKVSFSKQEDEFQAELDSLNETKSRLSQTEEIRRNQILKSEKDIRDIDKQLQKIKSNVDKLTKVEEAHQKKKTEFLSASESMNEEAVTKEICSMETEIRKIDQEIRSLDDEMLELNKQTGIRVEVDVLRKEKKAKEDAIKKLKSKHHDTLMHLLGHVPEGNIRAEVERFVSDLKCGISSTQHKQSQLNVKMATLETNRKTAKDELNKKEKELRDCEDQMFQVSGSRELETSISQLETQIRGLQNEKGSSIGTQYLYNSYIEKLKRPDPCCPLCHRDFKDQQDVEELITDLNTKVTALPRELDSKQKSIEDSQRKCNKLSEMRPVKIQIEKLNKEIPLLKSDLKNFESQIETCRNELSDLDEELMVKHSDESTAANMTKDLVLLEQHISELTKTEKQLIDAESKLGMDSDRTVSIVNEEKTVFQSQLANLRSSLKEQQDILKNYISRNNQLQKEVNELAAQLVQISKDAQTTTELQNRKRQLLTEVSNCESEISNIEEQLTPIQNQIGEVISKKAALANEKEISLNNMQQKLQQLKREIDNITAYHSHILKYVQSKGEAKLKYCLEQSEKIQDVIHKASELKTQLNVNWQTLSKDIDNHKTRLRELQDCQTLKTKQEKLRELLQLISDLKAKVGGYDIRSLLRAKKELVDKEDKMVAEINQEEGKYKQLEVDIKRQKSDLEVEMYRDVEKKYVEKLVELKTTQISSRDLQKYYIALDSAIMQYHATKMTEINKIIRDLWGRTYKGNDIDYIEIRSEASESRVSSSRRQYNYKVVMIKGNVEQVMRGRCSAGQKVLASLLIRLALAETFCVSCGVLALDEPTTNLDIENIESLSKALAEIVELRSSERQFQLIVISHDEDFVKRLGHVSSVDYYNRLEKNFSGHSMISRCYMQQSQMD
ncbi:DNA repair protein rad50 [Chamberlinius hualienensis]